MCVHVCACVYVCVSTYVFMCVCACSCVGFRGNADDVVLCFAAFAPKLFQIELFEGLRMCGKPPAETAFRSFGTMVSTAFVAVEARCEGRPI